MYNPVWTVVSSLLYVGLLFSVSCCLLSLLHLAHAWSQLPIIPHTVLTVVLTVSLLHLPQFWLFAKSQPYLLVLIACWLSPPPCSSTPFPNYYQPIYFCTTNHHSFIYCHCLILIILDQSDTLQHWNVIRVNEDSESTLQKDLYLKYMVCAQISHDHHMTIMWPIY